MCVCELFKIQNYTQANKHNQRELPVIVAAHLSHNLAVDLILQSFMLGGWTEDLVSQLDGTASMFDGVITHILQDR